MSPTIKFQIRQHPFNSSEARTLIAGLDDDIKAVYSDYDPAENLQPTPPQLSTTSTTPSSSQATATDLVDSQVPETDDPYNTGLFFFVAFAHATGDEVPAGCAALRLLTPVASAPRFAPSTVPPELPQELTYAELKRVYVDPTYRGHGVATALVGGIELFARQELKLDVVALEVGFQQNTAVELYRRMGYVQRPMYGDHVGMEPEAGGDSLCMEKKLS